MKVTITVMQFECGNCTFDIHPLTKKADYSEEALMEWSRITGLAFDKMPIIKKSNDDMSAGVEVMSPLTNRGNVILYWYLAID